MPDIDALLPLTCHPATPAPVVRCIETRVAFRTDGDLVLSYCLRGDMARLLIPTEHAPERTDLLWEHTCFEAFIGMSGGTGYREFNFSPSGQWASYAFSDYRQRESTPTDDLAPRITARLFAGRLELDAVVAANSLPSNPDGAPWRIGLSAVVEAADTMDGNHSYWALHHPSPRPDFHHHETFRLEIPARGR